MCALTWKGSEASTGAEHLQWCKDRAAQYLAIGDASEAWASFCSDMQKHDETRQHPALLDGTRLRLGGFLSTVDELRAFIAGLN